MSLILTLAFLPESREMKVFDHSQFITLFGFLFFSLNFCSADLHISVFIRPAMNWDKSGWSLEWVKMQCQDTSSWSYLVNPLVLRYVVLCWIPHLPFRVGLGMWRSAGLVSVILARLMQHLKILCDLWDFLNAFLQLNFSILPSVCSSIGSSCKYWWEDIETRRSLCSQSSYNHGCCGRNACTKCSQVSDWAVAIWCIQQNMRKEKKPWRNIS